MMFSNTEILIKVSRKTALRPKTCYLLDNNSKIIFLSIKLFEISDVAITASPKNIDK